MLHITLLAINGPSDPAMYFNNTCCEINAQNPDVSQHIKVKSVYAGTYMWQRDDVTEPLVRIITSREKHKSFRITLHKPNFEPDSEYDTPDEFTSDEIDLFRKLVSKTYHTFAVQMRTDFENNQVLTYTNDDLDGLKPPIEV